MFSSLKSAELWYVRGRFRLRSVPNNQQHDCYYRSTLYLILTPCNFKFTVHLYPRLGRICSQCTCTLGWDVYVHSAPVPQGGTYMFTVHLYPRVGPICSQCTCTLGWDVYVHSAPVPYGGTYIFTVHLYPRVERICSQCTCTLGWDVYVHSTPVPQGGTYMFTVHLYPRVGRICSQCTCTLGWDVYVHSAPSLAPGQEGVDISQEEREGCGQHYRPGTYICFTPVIMYWIFYLLTLYNFLIYILSSTF